MASFSESFDITKEELNKIGDAFKDKEFLQIFNDYCKEITDPENVKTYQKEMTQLERERGIDVTFLNPEAGFVIKTSVDGNRKAYVNICYNDNVEKPSSERVRAENGQIGRNWRVPHMLVPPRDDFTKYDEKTTFCTVYDVIFHSYTLHLAARFTEFRKMVIDTALDSIESKFNLKLDRKNLKYSKKLKFKSKSGQFRPAVIRKPVENFVKPTENDPLDEMYPHPFYKPDKEQSAKPKPKPCPADDDPNSQYTTPKYIIKQRRDVDFQDFRYNMTCRMNATIPNELSVEIDLPLLNSTADCQLDVTEKTLTLISENPAKYKLQIHLPYPVNETNGNAKFDRSRRKLIVTLPVVRAKTPVTLKLGKEDSGVESDHDSQESLSPAAEVVADKHLISEISNTDHNVSDEVEDGAYRTNGTEPQTFLDPNIEYVFPEYTHNVYKNILAFTLHVKNVEPVSVDKKFIENGVHVKFTSIGTGFYPVYYGFCVKFPAMHTFSQSDVSVETWDNNVIVQIPFDACDTPLCSYLTGLHEQSLADHKLSEPLITNESLPIKNGANDSKLDDIVVSTNYSDNFDEVTVEVSTKINGNSIPVKPSVDVSDENQTVCQKSHSYSESSGDELSISHSPAKARGILKHRRSVPRTINRSISESSVDDITFMSGSFDNHTVESNRCIPEEEGGEHENSLKKTVRFNDHVSKQIFRMNSSILGQKKKNQRKNRNKKRSQERRHSESELSETDDKKDRFLRKSYFKDRGHHSESELSEIEHKECTYKKSALKTTSSRERKRADSGIISDLEKESKEEEDDVKDAKYQIQSTNIDFKSDLIFDLDI